MSIKESELPVNVRLKKLFLKFRLRTLYVGL